MGEIIKKYNFKNRQALIDYCRENGLVLSDKITGNYYTSRKLILEMGTDVSMLKSPISMCTDEYMELVTPEEAINELTALWNKHFIAMKRLKEALENEKPMPGLKVIEVLNAGGYTMEEFMEWHKTLPEYAINQDIYPDQLMEFRNFKRKSQ